MHSVLRKTMYALEEAHCISDTRVINHEQMFVFRGKPRTDEKDSAHYL